MATYKFYNNKYWVLTNIRNFFIDSSRKGLCGNMAEDNIGKLCYQNLLEGKMTENSRLLGTGVNHMCEQEVVTKCNPYPSTKQVRCGVKTMKWQEPKNLTDEQKIDLSSRKQIDSGIYPQKFTDMFQDSQYVKQLTYTQYAEYDGTYLHNVLTILYHIHVAIGPSKRAISFIVSIINAAKYHDLIGLVCYKLNIEYPHIPLQSVESYALCITDREGNIIRKCLHLDPQERCSTKYGSQLSIIEKKCRDSLANISENVSKEKTNRNLIDDKSQGLTGHQRYCDVSENYGLALIEVPLNRVFQLTLCSWLPRGIKVDMVVSTEKVKIIQCRNILWKFWINKKVKEYESHEIRSCKIINSKRGCKLRLSYTKKNSNPTNEGSRHKHHDFLCSTIKAAEILECINNTLVNRDEGNFLANSEI